LQPGERCPRCGTGKVYDSPPRTVIQGVGQAPLAATRYRLQRLRCRLCEAIFTAALPATVAARPKYDPSGASMIALLRYGNGMPHYRLEGLQASLYVPLPDATQWDIISQAVPGPRAAFQELIRQAAQAPLLHNDDTPARVLSLMAERAKAEAAGQTPKAKAIQTSGIVAVVAQQRVVLFFTGHAHAGTNLAQVLAHRARELAPPIPMCDALASNIAGEFATILGHCLAHGRRGIVEVLEHFPQACGYVLEVLAKLYQHDASCRRDPLSPEQRLAFHQQHSGPLMQDLHTWMTAQFAQRQVEPNSGLGKALRYLLAHWSALTLFLRQAGAPLDNNLCERALKRAILHRKNSLFYKTPNGAAVGDIYMSLIHTCRLCDVNPFDYLQALQQHAQDVATQAALWLPWNYREQRARAP
jgi:transposase